VQDRRLREHVRAGVALGALDDAARRERMIGVAVEVDRPALERRRDERVADAAELVRGRVLQRGARI